MKSRKQVTIKIYLFHRDILITLAGPMLAPRIKIPLTRNLLCIELELG